MKEENRIQKEEIEKLKSQLDGARSKTPETKENVDSTGDEESGKPKEE